MTNIILVTEDEFDAAYPLLPNHLNPEASWQPDHGAGCLFETYGEELALVRAQNPRTIWTLLEGENGGPFVLSGYHFVNRLGYLISKVPIFEGQCIEVRIDSNPEHGV